MKAGDEVTRPATLAASWLVLSAEKIEFNLHNVGAKKLFVMSVWQAVWQPPEINSSHMTGWSEHQDECRWTELKEYCCPGRYLSKIERTNLHIMCRKSLKFKFARKASSEPARVSELWKSLSAQSWAKKAVGQKLFVKTLPEAMKTWWKRSLNKGAILFASLKKGLAA